MRGREHTHHICRERKETNPWLDGYFVPSFHAHRVLAYRIAFLYHRGANEGPMASKKRPQEGSLIVAVLIVLGLVFAGHWIVTYVKNSNPWALVPWYGGIAALIILFGLFTNLRRG
jgi:hypothetical protein